MLISLFFFYYFFIIIFPHFFQPENVVFTTRDSQDVKIIDFGLAQRVDPDRSVRALFGSAEFCAPELLNYEPVSFASDMWSLGVMAYIL